MARGSCHTCTLVDAEELGCVEGCRAEKPPTPPLTRRGQEFTDLRDELFLIREFAGLFLRIDLAPTEPDLEDAARTGHHADSSETIRVVVRDPFRQTDGFIEIASSGAVFDLELHD
jgi:hypothetical protein